MPVKPFIFRLQTALDHKINQEKQAKQELQRVNSLMEETKGLIAECNRRIKGIHDQIRELQKKKVRINEINQYQGYVPVLLKEIENQKNQLTFYREEATKIKAVLVEFMKERKVLEKVKARHYQNYLKQVLLEEQKLIDEMATNRFRRKDNRD